MVSETTIERIDMSSEDDLGSAIVDVCQGKAIGGWKLAGSFTYQIHLVLIFQK